jgi:hypothetical protein
MKPNTPIDEDDDRFIAIPAPRLTDEAVIYIHRALENYLDLFEEHYATQMWRYYRERERENITTSSPRPVSDDDEPL